MINYEEIIIWLSLWAVIAGCVVGGILMSHALDKNK